MPAIAPFTVHAASPGVRMSDVGLVGDEDFLLIHSVEDAAEYGQEVKRFNTLGEKIYHVLQDPSLTFSFDCDCLAFEGLANAHPGQVVTQADVNNIIPGAFGWNTVEDVATVCHYRRPRRRRMAGNLASLSFELHIELANATLEAPGVLSASTWGDPIEILTPSTDVFQADSIFSATIFWRRRATLDYTGISPTNDPSNLFGLDNFEYCQKWLAASAQPDDLAEFLVDVDSVGDSAENEIVEVFHTPSGTHWVNDPEGNRLPSLLGSNTNPIDAQVFPDVAARRIATWVDQGEVEYYRTGYFTNEADLTAFLAAYNGGMLDNGVKALVSLYDLKTDTWEYP